MIFKASKLFGMSEIRYTCNFSVHFWVFGEEIVFCSSCNGDRSEEPFQHSIRGEDGLFVSSRADGSESRFPNNNNNFPLGTRTKYFERMNACGDERSESFAFLHISKFSTGRSLDASEASFMGNHFMLLHSILLLIYLWFYLFVGFQ